jgi:predicted Zn-dependent peptidase
MFLADNMKGINSFDYIDDYKTVTKQYVEEILKDIFKEENMVLSIVK